LCGVIRATGIFRVAKSTFTISLFTIAAKALLKGEAWIASARDGCPPVFVELPGLDCNLRLWFE
jgi:hypothetical protein